MKRRFIGYRKGEKEAMIKAGFPFCRQQKHCGICIEIYRLQKRDKNGIIINK